MNLAQKLKYLLSKHQILSFTFVWIWAFLCHAAQILRYSNSLPIGDQWDSEAYFLFKPWVEGTFSFIQLFSFHNEHRILFKRIFDLIIFSSNSGYWDNRVLAIANASIYATSLAILGAIVCNSKNTWRQYILLAFILLLPITAANYENTIIGFQSPFYFLSLFALLTINILSKEHLSNRNATITIVLCIFSLGSIASGFLLAPIAILMSLLGLQHDQVARTCRVLLAGGLCIITLFGYWAISKAHNGALGAHSLIEFIISMVRAMAWPVPLIPVAWVPLLFWTPFTLLRHQKLTSTDRFFIGLGAWVFLQAMALAYARGRNLLQIESRYTDILMLGMIANLYFCCRLFADTKKIAGLCIRYLIRCVISMVILVTGACGGVVAISGINAAINTRTLGQSSLTVTQALLQNTEFEFEEGKFPLPYPYKARFLTLLKDPTVRQLLRIDQDGLPASCDTKRIGLLSRAICAGEYLIPPLAPQKFVRTENSLHNGALAKCSLHIFNGASSATMLSPDLPVRFTGWVGSEKSGLFSLFDDHTILLIGEYIQYAIATPSIRRPDVAASLGSSGYYWSGFDITASVSAVAGGDYEVVMQESNAAPCRTGMRVHMP